MASPRRKPTRLKAFDYASEGSYFVTLVTKHREHLFGRIVNDEMELNDFGRIVEEEWKRSAVIREEIELGEFVIMPNHFHGIVHIFNENRSSSIANIGRGDQNSLPSGVGAYGNSSKGSRGDNDNDGRGDQTSPFDVGAYGNSSKGDRPVAPTKAHGPPPKSLGSLVGGFKSAVTTRTNDLRGTPKVSVWQRSFFDHIIGIDREYEEIEKYILDNPTRWAYDGENKE